jgi:formiminoglutamase
MQFLKPYTAELIQILVRKRSGEEKIGEKISVPGNNWEQALSDSSAKFVVVGIPEDIGVRANYGRGGTHTAFRPALDSFLSQQSNDFLKGEDIMVLGEVDVDDLMHASSHLTQKSREDVQKLREFTAQVDEKVFYVISKILRAKKIPLIIGGGHNNSYGTLKASSFVLEKKVNAINCDAHLDFRAMDGRHSGNGFSYAFKNDYLGKYAVLGMHEQYNNQEALRQFKEHPDQLFFSSYEKIFVREEMDFKEALNQCIGFVKGNVCGVEIDLDAITNVPSSARTSSGISPVQARQYVYRCAEKLKPVYLHIAEGAPVLSHIKADNKTGKLIAYLLSDFIKGYYFSEK